MDNSTAKTINHVLKKAGIAPHHATVFFCRENSICKVRIPYEKMPIRSDMAIEEFMIFVNRWLALHPEKAEQRPANSSKLFTYIPRGMTLVDSDAQIGPDQVLIRFPVGWQRLDSRQVKNNPQLLFDLAMWFTWDLSDSGRNAETVEWAETIFKTADWSVMDNPLHPKEFARQNYAFEVEINPSVPPIMSPAHKVTLAGHPDIVIPWTDPYLIAELQNFYAPHVVRSFSEEHSKMRNPPFWRWYRQKIVITEKYTEDDVQVVPTLMEEVIREMTVSTTKKPEVNVRVPEDPNKEPYLVSVYGRQVKVTAYLSDTMTVEEKIKYLADIGESLQEIPESVIASLLDGIGQEKPLQILIAPQEKAGELGWPPSGNAAGRYSSSKNEAWLSPEILDTFYARTGSIFHEIAGHGISDYRVADDNPGTLVEMKHSALRDYYVWKLSQLFSPEELRTYMELSRQFKAWENRTDGDDEEGDSLERPLIPYRKKAYKRFVSSYAVEGSRGIASHLRAPVEDYAEVAETFWKCLSKRDGCPRSRSKEPLLLLIGLDYLFNEYKVSKIGNIRHDEVYSEKAFKEVLGIDLDAVKDQLEQPRYGNLLPDPRRGWIIPLTFGFHWNQDPRINLNRRMEDRIKSGGFFLSSHWGYSGTHIAGGIAADYSYLPSASSTGNIFGSALHSLDTGAWAHAAFKMGPLVFFAGPAGGIRNSWPDHYRHSLWMGGNAGIGVDNLNGALVYQGKFSPVSLDDWTSHSIGIRVDLPLDIRIKRLNELVEAKEDQ